VALVAGLAASCGVQGGTAVADPPSPPVLVSFAADHSQITPPNSTALYAEADRSLYNTGYQIAIVDDDGELPTVTCGSSDSCGRQLTASWSDNANPRPRRFHAEIQSISTGDALSGSSHVTVEILPYDFGLSVEADSSSIRVPDSTMARAQVNRDLSNTGYRIHIVDDDGETADSICGNSDSCAKNVYAPWSVNPNPTTKQFHAEVRSFVTGHVAAVSNPVTVVRRRFLFDVQLAFQAQTGGGWRATATVNRDLYNTGYQLKLRQIGGSDVCLSGGYPECVGAVAVGNTYRAVVENATGHVAGQSAAWTLTADGPVEETAGDVDLAALALALQGSDLCTRVGLAPYKTELVPPATSGGDQWEVCVNLVQAGKGTLAILAAIAATEGGHATINWLVSDSIKEAPAPGAEPDADNATAPRPLPLPWLPDVSGLAPTLTLLNPDLPQEWADNVANQCLFLMARAGENGFRNCKQLPIFASGADVPQATNHDLEALTSHFSWVQLNYEFGQTKPGAGWQTCPDIQPGQQCDEYPFFATLQGGPSAVPTPDLKAINSTQNMSQGGKYSAFSASCLNRETGRPFLGIPLPPAWEIPTLALCNGST
jgi:hypothetical protein